jgi:hypothetical protein
MPAISREQISGAFFDLIKGAANFTATSRRFVHWDQVNETQMPFLTMLKTGEQRSRQTEGLPALTINAHVFVYLHLAPQVAQIVKEGAPVLTALEQVEPAVLPLLENLAEQVFPQLDAAAAKTVIAKAAFAPQSWTPQEQQLWWDRASDQE